MRPALLRLLSRPPSLGLLRYLNGDSQELCPAAAKLLQRSNSRCCRYLSIAGSIRPETIGASDETGVEGVEISSPKSPQKGVLAPRIQNPASRPADKRPSFANLNYSPWRETLWTREQIDFESNLDGDGLKLLDQPAYRADTRLWACLFDYRRRNYGLSGVAVFWEAVKRGDFELSTTGEYSQMFWEEFVNLGLRDKAVLEEVLIHANKTLELTGKRWSKLYVKIIQYMLLNVRGPEAITWHDRLFDLHPPGPSSFAQMVRQVVIRRGDQKALKYIYQKNSHRNAYGKVVPFLCRQEDFKRAVKWHLFLVENGDLPATFQKVDPLLQFLAIYDDQSATRVTRSLAEAGVPFASTISSTLRDNTKMSREMINLVHGESLGVPVKSYNDRLGARWFATRWVSLDVAMNAISALGVQEIGPLSLQAIALREQDAESVTHRIDQLKSLDILIGNSTFSRSVEKFARTPNQDFLDGLLQSDQDPGELDDQQLQERLLTSYALSQDWFKYKLTMATRLIGSKHPEMETKNIVLRSHVTTGDTPALLASLHKMRMDGEIVTPSTVAVILRGILRPRQRGRRPVSSPIWKADDLKLVIDILRNLMDSGSFVPTSYWREIIKRLGMLGRLKELEDLCLFLASWYSPANTSIFLDPTIRKRVHQYRVPAQVKTYHPLHPLKILFPSSLQRAIVEWGFMHALRSPGHATGSRRCIHKGATTPSVTSGIELLKRLHRDYQVHVDINSVKKAIFDRLVTYYGPGRSNRRCNRRARENNVLELNDMANQIDASIGKPTFDSPYLGKVVESRGLKLMKREEKRAGSLKRLKGGGVLGLSY